MFSVRTAFLNIRRHRSKSILVVITCILTVVFAFIFMNSIQANQSQLQSLPQALPVTARIENLNGSQMVGLEISEDMIQKLAGSKHVKNLLYTAQLAANFPSVPDEANQYKKISIIAANDIQALPDLNDKQIKLADDVNADFLNNSDAICLADDLFMQKNNLAPGDTVDLAMYTLKSLENGQSFTFVGLGNCRLRIVGTIESAGSVNLVQTDIVCPYGWAKEKCAQAGVDFTLDSASFTVANPLDLNAFKAEMKAMYLLPIVPTADFKIYGDALAVKDETFIQTASRLKNSLAVLYAFEPVIFIMIALVGYALAYLLMQSRRAEIVIMRSLGNSRGGCVAVMFIEYAALGLAGCLLGTLCAAIFTGFAWNTLLIALLFFASLMAGILAAAFQISRGNTMTGNKKTEA